MNTKCCVSKKLSNLLLCKRNNKEYNNDILHS